MRRRTVWLLVGVLVWAVIAAVVYRDIAKRPETPPLRVEMTEAEVDAALGGYTKGYPGGDYYWFTVVYQSEPDALGRGRTIVPYFDNKDKLVRWEVYPWSGKRPPWLDRLLK